MVFQRFSLCQCQYFRVLKILFNVVGTILYLLLMHLNRPLPPIKILDLVSNTLQLLNLPYTIINNLCDLLLLHHSLILCLRLTLLLLYLLLVLLLSDLVAVKALLNFLAVSLFRLDILAKFGRQHLLALVKILLRNVLVEFCEGLIEQVLLLDLVDLLHLQEFTFLLICVVLKSLVLVLEVTLKLQIVLVIFVSRELISTLLILLELCIVGILEGYDVPKAQSFLVVEVRVVVVYFYRSSCSRLYRLNFLDYRGDRYFNHSLLKRYLLIASIHNKAGRLLISGLIQK